MAVVLLTGLLVSVLFVGVVAQIIASRQQRERRSGGGDSASGRSSTGRQEEALSRRLPSGRGRSHR
ncbi:hypothetical protein [Streptomyces sp. BE303]|uniref:hypothetical protein n=1 Tax=Streptomycetaceae TaxID=2062 RepID=UPI002E76C82C|nr:hypothetical protein [Streptomyces sp. BE303]MED7949816.1 hypothetical protein [Streptomyces sp. BE303]